MKTPSRRRRTSAAGTLVAGVLLAAIPLVTLAGEGRLQWQGDLRVRAESDWDSRQANGLSREDRDRLRLRARLGLSIKASESLQVGFRARSGTGHSAQSPHVTLADFNGNRRGAATVDLDKWFVRYRRDAFWSWVGRESAPFWQQNELFWDEDVTLTGAATGFGRGALALNAGYFSLPVGMRAYAGRLGAAQVVYRRDFGGGGFTLAAGLHAFDADPQDPDASRLRQGNGARDYRIAVLSGQWRREAAGHPLVLGVDVYRNTRSYPASDAFRDQRDGHVLSAIYGRNATAGDWLLGYYYADIEKLAVHASFAQDDWMRWGSAIETDASDFRGHELRLQRTLGPSSNLMLRYYDVEALTSVQDGKRLRLDYNWRF